MKNIFAIYGLIAVLVVVISYTLFNRVYIKEPKHINIAYSSLSNTTKKQVDCLTQNVFFEARQETETGQLAVAMVTMKRTKQHWARDVCGVVKQKANSVCQFSWWCDKNLQQKAINYNYSYNEKESYKQIRKVAMHVYFNYENIIDPTKGATFYHAKYINPNWNLKKTVTIGNHIFYRKF